MWVQAADLSDSLAYIEATRRASITAGADITPRLIAWGLLALAREWPGAPLGDDFQECSTHRQWRRIRLNLSERAIVHLHQLLLKEKGSNEYQR